MKTNSWPSSRKNSGRHLPNNVRDSLTLRLVVLVLAIVALLVLPRFSFGQSNCSSVTYTIGGWGADPQGSNPGTVLNTGFNSYFPNGLTIGCVGNQLTLSNPDAIRDYLRQTGGSAEILPGHSTASEQIVGAMLNMVFFNLQNQFITSGTYKGKSVSEFLSIANDAIGGCTTDVDLSNINSVATSINENYDAGNGNNGYLTCCNLTASSSAGAIACFGGSTTITVTPSGGTAPYSIVSNNGLTANSDGTFTVFSGGPYSFTVTDANKCTASTSVNSVSQPTQLTAVSTTTAILCYGGSSTITVTASGGTAPYTIGQTISQNGIFTFIVTAGSYSYTVTDANGCGPVTTSVSVYQPDLLEVNSHATAILCNGGTATVTVVATGGTSPYTLGQTTRQDGIFTFTEKAGSYTYTITDANNCGPVSTSVDITEPSAFSASISAPPILCNGWSTTITVTATGGTPPYAVEEFTSQVGIFNFIELAGTYTIPVNDANNCGPIIKNITIPQPDPMVATISATPILCYGGTSTLTVTVTGGTPPYSIGGVIRQDGIFTYTVPAGNYSYTVWDSHECWTLAVNTSITQPTALSSTSIATKVSGYKCNDGTITVTATGGSQPYAYSLNGGAYQASNVFTGLGVGTYNVMVQDANGCSFGSTLVVDIVICGGTTVTQGGWGAGCSGNNWGCYLQSHWAQIGTVVIGSGGRTLTLTSANAIHNFLPSGGTPRALDKSYVNPTQKGSTAYNNTLAGQAVALYLNLHFFNSISTLVINSGSFAGTSASEMLDIANAVLGGSTAYNASDVTNALDDINRNYDGGKVDNGFLSCPCNTINGRDGAPAVTNNPGEESPYIAVSAYPNPTVNKVTFEFTVTNSTYANFQVFTSTGEKVQTLFDGMAEENVKYNVEFTPANSGMYIYRISTKDGVTSGKVLQVR